MERTVVEPDIPNTCLFDFLAGDESERSGSTKVEYIAQ